MIDIFTKNEDYEDFDSGTISLKVYLLNPLFMNTIIR